MTSARFKALAVPMLAAAMACTQPVGADQVSITGESPKYDVTGQYQPLVLDQVDRLGREDGTVVVRGSSGSVPIELPAEADVSQPNPAWRLVTESNAGNGLRRLTFTHESSLEEFTILLPESQDELHYGAFLSRSGGSVLVFAWGSDWHCYWGYVTLRLKTT